MPRQGKKSARGFNLIEAAIVLGVTGLVIGGVWMAAAAVTEHRRVSSSIAEVLHIVEGVRNISKSTLVGNEDEEVSALLGRLGIIPSSMSQSPSLTTAWGAPALVVMGDDAVYVAFMRMPRSSCIRLAMAMSARDAEDGLSSTTINGPSGDNSFYQALSLEDASEACEDGATISWNYSLSGYKKAPGMGGGPSSVIGYDPPDGGPTM